MRKHKCLLYVIPIISKKVIHGERQHHKVCTLSFWFTELLGLYSLKGTEHKMYLQDVNNLFDIDWGLLDEQS